MHFLFYGKNVIDFLINPTECVASMAELCILTVLEPGSPSPGASVVRCRWGLCVLPSRCALSGQKQARRLLSAPLSVRAPVPWDQASTLWPHLTSVTSSKDQSSGQPHGGRRTSCIDSGGGCNSVHTKFILMLVFFRRVEFVTWFLHAWLLIYR